MTGALRAAATGMEAQMAQIENIANNLANVNTPGYKKSRAEFQDLLYETVREPGAATAGDARSPVGLQRGMGVAVVGTQRNFEMGPPQVTRRDLDFFIKGEGFFVVQLSSGEMAYRRDGSFYRGPTGRIETIDGNALQPEIRVPAGASRLHVSEDGTVSAVVSETERLQIGQIQLATFANNGGLKAIGKNLFLSTEGSGPPAVSTPSQIGVGGLLQGHLEGSNVEIVREMTDMIAAQRAFEMNSKVVQAVDHMLQNAAAVR